MGKTRVKKFGGLKKHNPTGLVDQKQCDLENELNGDANHVPEAINSIIEKVQSPGSEERACGCQLLASIVSHPKAISFLLKENAVRIVAPLFLDPDYEVRRSALGALRNMSVYGEESACDALVDSDVLTPLIALIKQYGDSWLPEKESEKCQNASDIMIEAIELLSNLCEHNSRAVMLFNKADLISLLIPLIKVDVYGYPLSQAVAHCFHIVSENNAQVNKFFQQQAVLADFYSIVSTEYSCVDGILFRTLVTGILLNMDDVDLSQYYNAIIKKTGDVIDMDILPVLHSALEDNNQSGMKDQYDWEPSWPKVDKFISAQRIGLELLANLCCSEDEWEEMEDEDSEESCDDLTVGASGEEGAMEQDTMDALCLPSEIHSAFTEHCIMSKIMKRACPLEPELVGKLGTSECGKSCLRKMQDLQSRALLCLSNTISALNESSLAQLTPLSTLWSQLYDLAKQPQDCHNEDYLWAISSAMRAVLQKMAETNATELQAASEADLDFIVKFGSGTNNTETQINVVKIISTIGCMLSLCTQPHPLLKTIGMILIQVCKNNQDIVVVAEALDSIFDVFKEDETDWAVKEIRLIEELKFLQSMFKTKVSKEKKRLGEKKGVVIMARTNLSAFIKYKSSHM